LNAMDLDQSPGVTVVCKSILGDEIVDLTIAATPDSVKIDYECIGPTGLAYCEMVLGLQLWSTPDSIKWRKACGGPRKDIFVTTKLEEYPIAWAKGEIIADWNLTLLPEENHIDFSVNATTPVVVTAAVHGEGNSQKSTGAKIAEAFILLGSSNAATAAGTITHRQSSDDAKWGVEPPTMTLAAEPQKFRINATCVGAGMFNATFKIEMEGYESINIPLVKHCLAEWAVTASGDWWDDWRLVATVAVLGTIVIAVPLIMVAKSFLGGAKA